MHCLTGQIWDLVRPLKPYNASDTPLASPRGSQLSIAAAASSAATATPQSGPKLKSNVRFRLNPIVLGGDRDAGVSNNTPKRIRKLSRTVSAYYAGDPEMVKAIEEKEEGEKKGGSSPGVGMLRIPSELNKRG